MRMTHAYTAAPRFAGVQQRARTLVVGVLAAALSACNLFETDINNPNAVVEDALADPSAAKPIVNGLGASLNRAISQVQGSIGAVTDELTWAGSREFWKLLDDGDISDPLNEYTDGQFPFLAEARWLGDYAVTQLEGLDKANNLRDRVDLVRAYTYAGLAYLLIAENYEDFVIASDRRTNEAPVGEANMPQVFDKAIAHLDKAVTLSTSLNNAEWRRNSLGLRARAKFSKAVRAKFGTARTRPSNPLVDDAGATADAQAALAAMTAGYRFRFTPIAQNANGYFNTGFEINQRLELRASDEYTNANAAKTRPLDGIAGIKLRDPVSNVADPQLARAIDECCRLSSGQFIPVTATSQIEMQLIVAEAALAKNDLTTFTSTINSIRAANGSPNWAGTPSALDILKHTRRVNLFMQGRRLMDHYRFSDPDPRWLTAQVTFRKTCFFPISYNERLQNPKAPQPAVERSAACR